MISMLASEIADVVGGVLHGGDATITGSAEISSRACLPGSIFIALKGEKVDGHDFVSDAFSHGANLAITTKVVSDRCIVVSDVTSALTELARHVRSQLSEMVVIGITGSQGKTTTKELLAAVLAHKGETIAPIGNHNNELGVPLTLLRSVPSTRYCVVEMGARHQGDIAHLCSIAQPNIGVVLRVAAAHLGEFGSIEKIAETKSEMVQGVTQDGVVILGDYDPYTPAMKKLHSGRTILFGEKTEDEVRAADIELRDGRAHFDLVTPEGRSTTALRLIGIHQISNALAAAAVAHALGWSTEEIAGALSLAESTAKWRMELHELPDLLFINDAYNASPDSMEAALRTLAHLSQERGGESWAFIGKMAELGESAGREHAFIGNLASEIGIDHLVAVAAPEYGAALPSDASVRIHYCADKGEAAEIFSHIHRGDVLLFKASRSEGLEELAKSFEIFWNMKIESEEVK